MKTLHKLFRTYFYFIVPFSFLMIVYGLVWLAFYPGIMTPDSLDQWGQVLAGQYNNGSPYLSTIIMGMFRFIKDTPAWLGLIQIVLTALLFASGVWYGYRKGVSRWILVSILLLAASSPTILLFSITLWKDILYSLLVVIISLTTAVLVIEKKGNKYLYMLLGSITAMVAVLRYNGLVYLLLPVILLLIFNKPHRRLIGYLAGFTLATYILLALILPTFLKVEAAPIMAEWLRMKNVGAIYQQNAPRLSDEQRVIFERVLSKQDWEQYYTCAHPDGLALKEENGTRHKYTETLFKDDAQEKQWKDAVMSAALANPSAIVQDKVCMAGYFLQRTSNVTIGISKRWDLPVVNEASKIPSINTAVTSYAYWTHTEPVKHIIHLSLGLYSLIFVIATAVSLWRKQNGLLVFCLLNLANIAFTLGVGFSSDFRYGYSVVLAGLLLPVVWLADKKKVSDASK